MAIIDGHIRCSGCGKLTSLDGFSPSIAKRGHGRCRRCRVRYGKEWRETASAAEIERVAAERHDRYLKTKTKTLENAGRRRQSPEWRARRRSWTLGQAYGITAGEYDAMLAAQGGGCACCGTKANRNGKRLFVDHDHVTGAIRGVLCNKCNGGIANLGDSIDGVRRALAYLERAKQYPPFREMPSIRINLLPGAN